MIKQIPFLLLLVGLTMVACAGGERSKILLTPDANPPSTMAIQEEPPASESRTESTPSTIVAPQINVKTDSELYKQGESIIVTIENNSANPIQFIENCSLNLCFESGENWICEERECDGPVTVLEPGTQLDIMQEAKSISLAAATDIRSRYKLDYQVISEDPFYFGHSNEFTVQSSGMNCKQAKQIALEQAQTSPYWNSIDASRATVQWQDENQTCLVDFAWQGAEQIRAGLWSEGYSVIVVARTGRVIEANAYER